MKPSEMMPKAIEHLRAGRLGEAEKLFREILAVAPGYPDVLHLLGCTLSKAGRADEAIELIRRAIAIDPSQGVFHNNLGLAPLAVGRRDEAVTALSPRD